MNEDHTAAIVNHPGFLDYDFGPQHPLRPERIGISLDLIQSTGLWQQQIETLTPTAASDDELAILHDPAYIRTVHDAGKDPAYASKIMARYGLAGADNPPFPDMHEAAALVAGGSIEAVRRIMSGKLRHAFNPAGGLHHAMRDRASGFCIYNDPALAAAIARDKFGARVLYVDFDCHHGDGVQWLFYDDPRVLTVSFHESGRYLFPGTGGVEETGTGAGRGYAVNVPMAPFTQDDSWLHAIHAVLPPLAERFLPDIIISAHGADTHLWDPLTHLALTTASFVDQARLVHDLSHRYSNGRWLATGSGGYAWRRVVPRSWSIVWAEMTGRSLPDQVPPAWHARWHRSGAEALPETYLDHPALQRPMPEAGETARVNRQTLQACLRALGLPGGLSGREEDDVVRRLEKFQ